MAKIYIVCLVSKATEKERERIIAYANSLHEKDHDVRCPLVRCPLSDTDQHDEVGLSIVEEHEGDIIWADEIHIMWNPKSEESLWDIAQARMAQQFMPDKRIRVVNPEEIEITDHESYANVILATHLGFVAKNNPHILTLKVLQRLTASRAADKREED